MPRGDLIIRTEQAGVLSGVKTETDGWARREKRRAREKEKGLSMFQGMFSEDSLHCQGAPAFIGGFSGFTGVFEHVVCVCVEPDMTQSAFLHSVSTLSTPSIIPFPPLPQLKAATEHPEAWLRHEGDMEREPVVVGAVYDEGEWSFIKWSKRLIFCYSILDSPISL